MRPDALAWLMRLMGCRIEADWGETMPARESSGEEWVETHVLTFRPKG